MRECDQLHPLVQARLECVEVDLAEVVVGNQLDGDATVACLDEPERVRDVLAAAAEYAVTRSKGHRAEGAPPGIGSADTERDLGRFAIEEFGGGPVHAGFGLGGQRSRFVPSDLGLELQVMDDGVDHRSGRKRRPGVVEMDEGVDGRRVLSE